jgi:SMI1 / KNR4 family (SUKH-1)
VTGVSDTDWTRAEQALGRRLPADLREFLDVAAGKELLRGNLKIYPVAPPEGDDEALTLTTVSDLMRSWDWPVPDEMVIFGDNGQGDSFGLWVPRDGGARPLVVEIGEVFEDACLAVVGDDLASFLRGWTDYYTQLEERDLNDDDFYEILGRANPGLPDPRPDPYKRGLTAAQVDEIARSDGR